LNPLEASISGTGSGGIAISDSFYRNHFQMIPGESLNTSDICGDFHLNGELLEEAPVISMTALDTGARVSYKYAPCDGWQKGNYKFTLEIMSQIKADYTSTDAD